MTKYTFQDKRNVVAKYVYNHESYNQIINEYHIGYSSIREWVHDFKEYELKALYRKRSYRKYDSKFKINVIKYYLNHNEGIIPVAAHFGINSSQVELWKNLFNSYGIRGLKPLPKGETSESET